MLRNLKVYVTEFLNLLFTAGPSLAGGAEWVLAPINVSPPGIEFRTRALHNTLDHYKETSFIELYITGSSLWSP